MDKIEKTFTTGLFSVPRSTVLRAGLSRHTALLATLISVPVVVCVGLALALDLRWLIVMFMCLLIVSPMVLAFLYFRYALSPRCYPNSFPHTVTVDEQGILLNGTMEISALPDKDVEMTDSGQAERKTEDTVSLHLSTSWEEIWTVRCTLNDVRIFLKGSPAGMIILPYSVLEDADACIRLIRAKSLNFL